MLLETETTADEPPVEFVADGEPGRKRTVEELIDLLRVDDPDPRVTPEVRRKLAEELAWLLAPDDASMRKIIVKYRGRTPEEVFAIRARLSAKSRPPRPLPPGMTLEDVTVGKWPGDETDEQVRRAMADDR